MTQPVQHNLIDFDLYQAVYDDHQPREAAHLTTYDDGTTAETAFLLYWQDGEVRSCPIEDWPPPGYTEPT